MKNFHSRNGTKEEQLIREQQMNLKGAEIFKIWQDKLQEVNLSTKIKGVRNVLWQITHELVDEFLLVDINFSGDISISTTEVFLIGFDKLINMLYPVSSLKRGSVLNTLFSTIERDIQKYQFMQKCERQFNRIDTQSKDRNIYLEEHIKDHLIKNDIPLLSIADVLAIKKICCHVIACCLKFNIVEQTLVKKACRHQYITGLTDNFRGACTNEDYNKLLYKPRLGPMVVLPIPWDTDTLGGYLSGVCSTDIIRNRHSNLSEISQPFFDSVNALNGCRWRVNVAASNLFNLSINRDFDNLNWIQEVEPKPEYSETEDRDRDSLESKAKRNEMFNWYANKSLLYSRRKIFLNIQNSIKDLALFKEFYFTYSADFRGRLYCYSDGLNPQGSDVARGCLEFADGKVWGTLGREISAICLANYYGIRGDNSDLLTWTTKNHSYLREVANDPESFLSFLNDADKPYSFMALLNEYICGLDFNDDMKFISHVPIVVDGTANGLQHLSMLLKDDHTAKSVNLINGPRQDIYSIVADACVNKLKTFKMDNDILKKLVDHIVNIGLDRSIIKPLVIAVPFGARTNTLADKLCPSLYKLFEDQGLNIESELGIGRYEIYLKCCTLTNLFLKVIVKEIPSIAIFKKYCDSISDEFKKKDVCLSWRVPNGFIVKTKMVKYSDIKSFNFKKINFNTRINKTKIDYTKMRKSLAANIIHSLDACHLSLILESLSDITESVTTIHDCIGCHAGVIDEVQILIRQKMYKLHSELDLSEMLDTNIELPVVGDYCYSSVLDSSYFFC